MHVISGNITGTSPQRLTFSDNLTNYFFSAVMFGYKTFVNGVPTANSSGLYVGFNGPDQLPIIIPTGSFFNYEPPIAYKDRFSNVWINGASGDGIFMMAYP